MADNIAVTAGSGTTVRSDDVGGVQIQAVKIVLGADGAEDNLVDSGQQASSASVPVTLASDTPAPTGGGVTPYHLVSAANANPTSVKASAGALYSIHASNKNASARYLHLFDKASAPTVGTDVPKWTLLIPVAGQPPLSIDMFWGLKFSLGIAFCITTGNTDLDTGVVAANDIVVNLGYS